MTSTDAAEGHRTDARLAVASRRPASDVSVVIPSHRRPLECRAAILSALAQTSPPREVLLVVDGTDASGYDSVEDDIGSDRVRVLRTGTQGGPSVARNLGTEAALAGVVAYLDDDDVWLPTKLERQLAAVDAAGRSGSAFVSTTAVVALGPGTRVQRWPRRDPDPGEPVAEFLVGLGRPPRGGRVIQTSTFLASTDVARSVTMRGSAYEDWDWLIRAAETAPYVHVPEPLTVFHRGGASLTSRANLADGEAWLEGLRPHISDEVYAAACLTVLTRRCADGSARDLTRVLTRSFRGRPTARHLAEFPLRVLRLRLSKDSR
jgi:glycosyltransferase involved in cell wall biosynthesis